MSKRRNSVLTSPPSLHSSHPPSPSRPQSDPPPSLTAAVEELDSPASIQLGVSGLIHHFTERNDENLRKMEVRISDFENESDTTCVSAQTLILTPSPSAILFASRRLLSQPQRQTHLPVNLLTINFLPRYLLLSSPPPQTSTEPRKPV